MLELDIQLFNDSDTINVDIEGLSEEEKIIQSAANELNEEIAGAQNDIDSLESEQAFQSMAGEAIQNVFNYLGPKLGEFQTVVGDLGTFLSFVVNTYKFSDEEMKKEFDLWSESITGVVNNIKTGLNSTVGKGTYTTSQYITHMSESTRNIVNEVSTMAKRTGDLYTSATGKTVIQSVEDFSNAAIGSIGTLFGSTGSSGFTSIATSFVNALLNPLKM